MRHKIIIALLLLIAVAAGARPRIGVVLGGGGAKGAAEVGVLKVIEACGIPIDCIAGTSIGAVVGSLYAAGYSAAELEQLMTSQQWVSLLTDRRDDLADQPLAEADGLTYVFGFPFDTSPETAVFRGERIRAMLDSLLTLKGCRDFADLPTPFRCVGARFWEAKEVVMGEGCLADAVRSSMAIPLLVRPGVVDETRLVDGGMMNNLPIDVAKRDLGADIVIVVDLAQEKPRPRAKGDDGDLWAQLRQYGAGIFDGLMGSNLISWVLTRPDDARYIDNLHLITSDDIYINPRLDGFGVFSFNNEKLAQMVAEGFAEARRHAAPLLRLRVKSLELSF